MPENKDFKQEETMEGLFRLTRYSVLVAVLASLVGQFLMLYVGSMKVYDAFRIYFTKPSMKELKLPDHLSHSDVAIALIIESLDAFLVGLVLFYFAYGIYRLYLVPKPAKGKSILPMAPSSLGDLKETLAQVIVVVLFILFARIVWLSLEHLQWDDLVLPISIALLALSIKLAKFK